MKNYSHLFVAGTFDGLHAGHQAVINTAFRVSEKVTIGLTSDGFVARFKSQIPSTKSQTILKFKRRKQKLHTWLFDQGFLDRATVIPIDDPYEPAASMKDLDALIVTAENRKTGEHINVLRQSSTLSLLSLIDVAMVPAEDGRPISSMRMRNGEIDHNGRLVMPESMRLALGKPMGKVLKNWIPDRVGDDKIRITVGDIATKTFLDAGRQPFLAIIDGKVGRKPYPNVVSQLRKTLSCEAASGPGFISQEAVEAIRNCFAHQRINTSTHNVLVIDGEEDLLVLPAIIHAPIGAVVYYGQPNEGLVEVVVTKGKKQQALALLRKFT